MYTHSIPSKTKIKIASTLKEQELESLKPCLDMVNLVL